MARWTPRWLALRAVLFALLLSPLALSAALPAFARLAAGPRAHVCHCESRGGHSTCACPICHPDRPDFLLREASIRGRCGDEDPIFAASHAPAVLPATLAMREPPSRAARVERALLLPPEDVDRTPPTPPPRTRS